MTDPVSLHPAENRGYRELYATTRGLVRHWARLGERIADPTARQSLDAGVALVRRLLAELPEITVEQDLHGGPAALGLGARLADLQSGVVDRLLERNQAMRLAVLEAHHLRVLLAYLNAVAGARHAETRAEFCGRWEGQLEVLEEAAREAAVALGADPDGALEPVDRSILGRAGHGLAYALGALGEIVDQRAAQRGRALRRR